MFRFRKCVYIFLFFLTISCAEKKHRSKRYLVWPRGGSYKMVIGIGIPIKIGSKQSMALGWNFQAQYAVPTNITYLEQFPPTYTGRRSVPDQEPSVSDRRILYDAVEGILDGEGFNGRECILRSICENAVDSFHHDDNGLWGQLFHIAFTPTYGDGEVEPDLDPAYLEAESAGEYGVECDSLYPNCGLDSGFLGLFSVLENDLLSFQSS